MPFKSKAQERFMYAKHPSIAKRWQKEAPVKYSSLPAKRRARVVAASKKKGK